MTECKTLDDYLERYGQLLGRQAEASLDPLHVPGKTPLPDFSVFTRKPKPAQAHLVAGKVVALNHQGAIIVSGECGVGKTTTGIMTVHLHARGGPYRALVMCPGHLTQKWPREIREVIPGVKVTVIESCWQMLGWRKGDKPTEAEWFVIARDRSKLGSQWAPAATKLGRYSKNPMRGGLRCPRCATRLEKKDGTTMTEADLGKRQQRCPNEKCGEMLWTFIGRQQGGIHRWEPARYIHKRLKGYFDYLIIDEAHEEKSADSAQGMAAGSLAAACKKTIAMTGTLIGGYANHIRPLLFRLAPQTLIAEGLGWNNPSAFDKRYGRIERTVTEKEGGGSSHRQSRGGGSRRVVESVKPGIMPTLFGRHLLGNCVYLSLEEVSNELPELREIIVPVEMDAELAGEYERIERKMKDENDKLLVRGVKCFLGAMLQTALAYPDMPYGWDWVGYWWGNAEGDGTRPRDKEASRTFMRVVQPADLGKRVRPKEEKLIEIVRGEKEAGRQVWVFVQYTDKHNVQKRLVELLEAQGFVVKELRSDVPLVNREKWIAEHGPGADVIVSHPKLVETGLDLFDKGGRHNFVSLVFYETGYNLFTLRQAGRRSWRIGQREECRVYYLYYEGTMQARAMSLMGRKLSAAQALEGKFTSEGLVAMGGDDLSVEMALAQSLDSALDLDTSRAWGTIAEVSAGAVTPAQVINSYHLEPANVAGDEEIDELEEILKLDDLTDFGQDGEDDMLDFLDSLAELDGLDLEDVA